LLGFEVKVVGVMAAVVPPVKKSPPPANEMPLVPDEEEGELKEALEQAELDEVQEPAPATADELVRSLRGET